MTEQDADPVRALMLDGNAAGGLLHDVFAREMTVVPAQCAACGTESAMGALLAFTRAPGLVLRCPGCEGVVLRIVQSDDAIYLDARGAACIRLPQK